MLNKKAIAAFAAGATLLSGFAFAAPAMADSANLPQTAIENAKKQEKADAAELAKKLKRTKLRKIRQF